ncbi:MAG: Wzt carbohydrate-binding domain-containing protein, partial [Blastocatellia bacterium]|nr:Wzt carbohydrate-binding domain-containing protein [Blastocatellia bacterium]
AAQNGGIFSQNHDEILRVLRLTGSRWGNGKISYTRVEMINSEGEATWVFNSGDPVTIRLHFESDRDYEKPIFAIDIHRFDGVFVGSVNNHDTHPTQIPIRRGAGSVTLHIEKLELPQNSYFLSLKAYTESDEPHWRDPADIHNQMYQFEVKTRQLIHGLLKFEGEWEDAVCSVES